MPKRKKFIIVSDETIPKTRYHETSVRLDCHCGSKLTLSTVSKTSYLRHFKCIRHTSICGLSNTMEEDWAKFCDIHFIKPSKKTVVTPIPFNKHSTICGCGKHVSIYKKKYNFVQHIQSHSHVSRCGQTMNVINAWRQYNEKNNDDEF